MFRDGAQAVDAKNFFLDQPECAHVTLEGQNYVGKYASEVNKILMILFFICNKKTHK